MRAVAIEGIAGAVQAMSLIEIKSWRDGHVIYSGEFDSVRLAVEAANLRGANLRGAYLRGANLRGAYLRGANLRDAKGISPLRVTPLLMLLDQPGKIRAYKLVDAEGCSPINDKKLTYEKGKTYEVKKPNCDVNKQCGAGINVATMDWCLREWREGWRILVVEFTAKDIAAIPTATDGKFRLYRCKVVGEKDLAELGLTKKVKP